ncbi:MAG: hypothetical protein VYA30_09485 [Myxococcota bacterium]|nr:hypothetical protein [Myxococcota bacterium]
MGRRFATGIVIFLQLFGCQTDHRRSNLEASVLSKEPSTDPLELKTLRPPSRWEATHLVTEKTEFYLDGPQQARPADGTLPAKTRVRNLANHGSYCFVETVAGRRMHISTNSVRALANEKEKQ